MATKTARNHATIERLLDEVDEWCGRVKGFARSWLLCVQVVDEYLDLLPTSMSNSTL